MLGAMNGKHEGVYVIENFVSHKDPPSGKCGYSAKLKRFNKLLCRLGLSSKLLCKQGIVIINQVFF